MKDKQYNLFGTIWTIKYKDAILDEDNNWIYGMTAVPENIVYISTKDHKGNKLPKNEIEITTLHEIIHSVFHTGQYIELFRNENVVEWLARSIKALKDQKII